MEGTYQYANWVIWGLIVYVVAMLGVGYYASRRIKDTTDYVVAGRRLGVFFTTGTTFATWFGAGTCMGAAGYAYIFGNQGIIIEPWGAALCVLLMGLFFARLVRRGKFLTLADFYTSRYGKPMGLIGMIILCLADMGWLGGLLVGFGAIINYFTGIGLTSGIMLSTLIVVIYTYLGGMWAVTLTDVFQMIILILGITVLFFSAIPHIEGGFSTLFSNDPTGNWSNINQWSFIPTPELAANKEFKNAGFLYYTGYVGWFYWIASWMAVGIGGICTQSLQQRFMAAKDESTAARAGVLSSILYLTVAILPVLLGMLYFRINPDLSLEQASNEILLRMAVDYLNPFMAVLFIIALVAAIMSSGDSVILGVAAIAGRNIVGLVKGEVDETVSLKYIRFFVPVVAFISMTIALYFQAILNLIVLTACLTAVCLFAPFVTGFLWKKANTYGALAASIGGGLSWLIGYFVYLPLTKDMNTGVVEEGVVYFDWAMWDAAYISSVWAFIISFVLMFGVSLATQKTCPPLPVVDVDGDPLSTKDFFGIGAASES